MSGVRKGFWPTGIDKLSTLGYFARSMEKGYRNNRLLEFKIGFRVQGVSNTV